MTLGLHLSSLLGSVFPSVSLSLPPCLPLSFLVLARWGEGPSTQRAGVGSLRQQGAKPRRAKSQQPLDTSTLQGTYSECSREHTMT